MLLGWLNNRWAVLFSLAAAGETGHTEAYEDEMYSST